jgi:phosphoserine phosphatase
MTGGIGTRGEVDNGVYTGRLAGPFCYGPGKAEAIAAIAAERNINLADSWSY